MDPDLEILLQEKTARENKNNPNYYKPFNSDISWTMREHYRKEALIKGFMDSPPSNSRPIAFCKSEMLLSTSYRRLVIGDYGAYVEIDPHQMVYMPYNKFPGNPRRDTIKYIWQCGPDNEKIYFQLRTVSYADYIPGMYYISPDDIKLVSWLAPG